MLFRLECNLAGGIVCYVIVTPPSYCPSEMFTWVLVTEKHDQIFTGELKVCNEDSMIIGGELFLRGDTLSNFSLGLACLQPMFHL